MRAISERSLMEAAWRGLGLSVQTATKLNRTHLITARTSHLLPTLARSEIDAQVSGPQTVTIKASTTCIHASRGSHRPAAVTLLPEPRIVAEIDKACLTDNPAVPWDTWVGNYALIREEIAAIYPEDFHDFNARLDLPGGFTRPVPARTRNWKAETGKANYKSPTALHASFNEGGDNSILRLITLRSNDQFNTTVYGSGRLRGINHSRMIVMMNAKDRQRFGIRQAGLICLSSATEDGITRTLCGLQIVDYDIPEGTIVGYFPECNALIPLWHYAEGSKSPAAKSVPARVNPDVSQAQP